MSETEWYGACYLPRPEVVQVITSQLLLMLCTPFAPDIDPVLAGRERHDLWVCLCAYLTAAACGTRIAEITHVRPVAVDLAHDPPLIALHGKGNRFAAEARVLALPESLAAYWATILRELPNDSLYAHTVYGNGDQLRPLRDRDIYLFLERAAKRAGFAVPHAAFKFHSFRHRLQSTMLEQNIPHAIIDYTLGHQTQGAAFTDPIAGGNMREAWRIGQHVGTQLLANMGLSVDMLTALTQKRFGAVYTLLNNVPLPVDDMTTAFFWTTPPPDESVAHRRHARSRPALTALEALPKPVSAALRSVTEGALSSRQAVVVAVAVALRPHVSQPDAQLELPEDFLQEVFIHFCQPEREAELSRRQRLTYVRHFNTVRSALQPFTALPLREVHNYPRQPRPSPIQPRIALSVRTSEYGRLVAALETDILTDGRVDAECWFARFALWLMLRHGVSFGGVLSALCHMCAADVALDHVLFYRDPIHARFVRIWLDDVGAIALVALLLRRAGRSEGERTRKRTLQPLDPQIVLATGVTTDPPEADIEHSRHSLRAYLADLCTRLGIAPLSLTQAQKLARWTLYAHGIYPGAVIAQHAGTLPNGVLPLEQARSLPLNLGDAWHVPSALPLWIEREKRDVLPRPPVRQLRLVPSPPVPFYEGDSDAEELRLLTELSARQGEIAVLLRQADREGTKAGTASRLEALVRQWLTLPAHISLHDGLRAAEQGERFVTTFDFNTAALAGWLAHLVRSQRIKTPLTYLSDAVAILRLFPSARIPDLTDEDAEDILAYDQLMQPPQRRASAWQSWHTYLRETCSLDLSPLNLRAYSGRQKTATEVLLTPDDLCCLMERLIADNGHLARQAYLAAPFTYFGMLRLGEIVRLRLCDIILDGGDPHLIITRSKRGKSRIVYLRSPLIPPAILDFMRDAVQHRLLELREQHPDAPETELRRMPLLINTTGETLNPAALSHMFTKALDIIAPGCTTHSLRKSGATWRYIHGVDVRNIAYALGHASPDVTFLAYLRTVDLDQRRIAQHITTTRIFTPAQLADLLDVSPRMGQVIAKGRMLDVATVRRFLITASPFP